MPTITLVDGSHETQGVPVGALLAWPVATPPARHLLCNGQQVAIASYPELYRVITGDGTYFPYGANTNGSGGAGNTHFLLPNLTGKFVAMASSTATRGTTGGASSHNHSISPVFAKLQWYQSGGGTHSHDFTIGSAPGNFLEASSKNDDHGHDAANRTLYGPNTVTNAYRTSGTVGTASDSHAHGGAMTITPVGDGGHAHSVQLWSHSISNDVHYHEAAITNSSSSTTNSGTTVDDAPPHLQLHYVVCAVAA
jgi:microcystin-dependent protein